MFALVTKDLLLLLVYHRPPPFLPLPYSFAILSSRYSFLTDLHSICTRAAISMYTRRWSLPKYSIFPWMVAKALSVPYSLRTNHSHRQENSLTNACTTGVFQLLQCIPFHWNKHTDILDESHMRSPTYVFVPPPQYTATSLADTPPDIPTLAPYNAVYLNRMVSTYI